MSNLIFKSFLKKQNMKVSTMNESDLQRVYLYPIIPIGSKIYSDKSFVDIDDGSMGGFHWISFYIKDNKSYHFDSYGRQPYKFLLNQLPKPIIYLK